MQTEFLAEGEWEQWGKRLEQIAKVGVQTARLVVCTSTQVASKLVKNKTFDVVINHKTSVTPLCEILVAWRRFETLILIGNNEQLGPTVLTGRAENPILRTLKDSAFAR